MRALLLFATVILLASCAPSSARYYTQTVRPWRGGDVQTLLKQWGRPDMQITAFDGNTFYIYKSHSPSHSYFQASPSIGVNTSGPHPVIISRPPSPRRTSSTISCVTSFEVNAMGKIVGTQAKGFGCRNLESLQRQ